MDNGFIFVLDRADIIFKCVIYTHTHAHTQTHLNGMIIAAVATAVTTMASIAAANVRLYEF